MYYNSEILENLKGVFMYSINLKHLTVIENIHILLNYCNTRISLENATMQTFLPI